jgi:hypothetical protein
MKTGAQQKQDLNELLKKVLDVRVIFQSIEHYDIGILLYIIQEFYKMLPFKKGNKVKLIKEINFEKANGWKSYKNFLIPGATGVVRDIKVFADGVTYLVAFDNEHYEYCTPNKKDRLLFMFEASYLEKL